MGSFKLRTKNGYDFYEVASALQKSIRRNDVVVAAFFGVELWQSGFGNYVWKRLYTISAEDCWGLITHEIDALRNGYVLVNKGAKEPKGRIFIGKAVILLCECYKSRDADHLNNLAVDRLDLSDERVLFALSDARREPMDLPEPIEVPEYTYDVHTRKGKKMGKTREQFFHEEHEALTPRVPGLFDNLVP